MTDRTNECGGHSLLHGCTMSLKKRFEDHLFDHKESDIQADSKHNDLWTGIKEKVSETLFYWVVAGIFVAMMILFGLNKEAISEVNRENTCTSAKLAKIEKKIDRIAIEMKIRNWDELDGE